MRMSLLTQHQVETMDNPEDYLSHDEEETNNNSNSPDAADEDAEDAEDRLARSRERNREHARRTRLRKKAQLRALQSRVKQLQEEGRILRQTVEECSVASILLGLSSGAGPKAATDAAGDDIDAVSSERSSPYAANFDTTLGGKRKRFLLDSSDRSPRPMKLRINGKLTEIGGDNGKAHINWKTGVFCDEDGKEMQLSPEELEELRRERNRMHAKMTRDRKKTFISAVEKTIADLERENERMREILAQQARKHFPTAVVGEGQQRYHQQQQQLPQDQQQQQQQRIITPYSTPQLVAMEGPVFGRMSPSKLPLIRPLTIMPRGMIPPPTSFSPALTVESARSFAEEDSTSTTKQKRTTPDDKAASPPRVIHGFSIVG